MGNALVPVRFPNGAAGRDGAVRENIARFNVNDIIRKPTPWRHENRPPWINGTTVDGVIHALSTA
ncbi:MAG: hypothetical protein OXI79_02235, partial [Gammaproteobacteria bacterium]|nr:hypothetical protein [Gammaproteobacteria bacterium]